MFKIHKYVFRIRYRFHIEAYCIKIYLRWFSNISHIQSRRYRGMKVVEPEIYYKSRYGRHIIFSTFSNIPTDEYLMVELGNVWEVVYVTCQCTTIELPLSFVYQKHVYFFSLIFFSFLKAICGLFISVSHTHLHNICM